MNSQKSTELKLSEVPSVESQLERLLSVSLAVIYGRQAQDDFALTFVSDNLRSILGYEPSQFIQEADFWKRNIHPDDVESVGDGLEALFKSGRHYQQYRFRHADGTYRWMADYQKLVRNTRGGPVEIVGHWKIDATYDKDAFDELQRTQEGYRQLIDSFPHGILECDRNGRIVFSNRAHRAMTGYESEELIGTYAWDRVHSDTPRSKARADFARVVSQEAPAGPMETRIRAKDGSLIDLQLDWAQQRDREGKLQGFTAVFIDITDRKRVTESKDLLAKIVNASSSAIIRADIDGTVTSWNSAAENLYGYSAADIIGRPTSVFIPMECWSETQRMIQRGVDGHSTHLPNTVRLTKGGRRIEVALSIFPIRDESGTVTALASISHDIREQKQLERKFQWTQRMDAVGRLAGGVAHELNNNLTVILGQAKAIGSSSGGDEPALTNRVNAILRSAHQATNLVRQLLAHARLQGGRAQTLNLNRTISAMAPVLETTAGKDITVRKLLETNLGSVEANPDQIEQIILNLTINACDAMPSGGELTIQTENANLENEIPLETEPAIPPGSYVVLKVSDTGSGMDPETLARVFEPFYSTKDPSRGPGLGLASVYGIVKQHGGRIHAESERGIGSTFTVYLPQNESVLETSPP